MGRDPATLDQAVRLGAIHRGTTDLERRGRAEVVVVCTPVSRVADDVRRAAEAAPGRVAGHGRGQLEAADRRGRGTTPALGGGLRGRAPVAGSERRGVITRPRRPVRGSRLRLDAHPAHPAGPARRRTCSSGRRWVAASSRWGPPSTTRSWPTPAICRTRWPPPWRRPFPTEWLPLAAGAYRDVHRVAAADTGLWTAIFRDNRGPLTQSTRLRCKNASTLSSTP